MHYEYLEHDLGTAAFLVVLGFQLSRLQPDEGGRYAFCFDDPTGHASEAAIRYLRNEQVPARALITAQKDLKDHLYRAKGRDGYGNNRYERPR